jgi:hypothetical protein
MANNDDELQLDDIAPNDGILFADPVQQQRQSDEEASERAMITGAQPILDDLFGWINGEIKMTETILPIDTGSNIEVTTQVMAQKLLREKLVALKLGLRNMADRWEVPYSQEVAEQER